MGRTGNFALVGFLILILLIGLSLGVNYFVFPDMYKDFIEKQGLPVYPNSKIRIAELTAKAHSPLQIKQSNFLHFFYRDNRGIGFFLNTKGSFYEISEYYKEKLKNRANFKFKEGISKDKTRGEISMKVGEKNMVKIICDYKCDSDSGDNHISISIPDPGGDFVSDAIHGWDF